MAKAKTPSARALAARKGWERRRRAEAAEHRRRSLAARQGWETRRRNERKAAREKAARRRAVEHGKKARERTEARLTPQQRAARTKDANRIERATKKAAARRPTTATTGRTRKRPSIVSRKSIGTNPATTASGRKSTPKRRRTSTTRTKPPGELLTFGRTGSGDKLVVQIGVRAQLPAGMVPTNKLLNDAIAYRVREGVDHPRFTTKIIRWQNPGRKSGPLRQWRQGNQADAWLTLGPAIAAAVGRA